MSSQEKSCGVWAVFSGRSHYDFNWPGVSHFKGADFRDAKHVPRCQTCFHIAEHGPNGRTSLKYINYLVSRVRCSLESTMGSIIQKGIYMRWQKGTGIIEIGLVSDSSKRFWIVSRSRDGKGLPLAIRQAKVPEGDAKRLADLRQLVRDYATKEGFNPPTK
jgi:hypothetical protein